MPCKLENTEKNGARIAMPTTAFKCIIHVRYDQTRHTHTHRSRLFIFIPCYIFFFVFEGGKNHSTNADCAIWIALAVSRDTTDAIRDLTQRYYFKWKLRTGKNRSISSDLQVGATKCVVCFKMPAQPPVCWILISQSFKCTYRMWRMRQIRP